MSLEVPHGLMDVGKMVGEQGRSPGLLGSQRHAGQVLAPPATDSHLTQAQHYLGTTLPPPTLYVLGTRSEQLDVHPDVTQVRAEHGGVGRVRQGAVGAAGCLPSQLKFGRCSGRCPGRSRCHGHGWLRGAGGEGVVDGGGGGFDERDGVAVGVWQRK